MDPMRVLIVDDNEDAAQSLAMLLELHGHEVQTAHTGQQARAAVEGFHPDIAFLDIGLPDMTGYELAGLLRAQPELAHTRLVALTGWGTAEDRERTRRAGFDTHLTKPVDFDHLQEVLAESRTPEFGTRE